MEERSNVLNLIIERLAAMLGAKEYTEETKYADIGMKSGNYSAMITLLEDEFDVEIPFMQFRRKPTIGESVDYVCELLDE